MAVTFRAVATATTGAAAATSLTIAKPAGVANGDALVCVMAVSTAASFLYTIPPGWGLISSRRSPGLAITLLTFGRQGKAADAAAGWTWVFDSARNACGSISAYYDTTAATFVRVCSITEAASASGLTHNTPAITSNVAGQFHLAVYAASQQDTWTHDAAYTERDDTTTTSGAADLCVTIGDLALAGTGTVAAVTATLDSAVAADGCVASLLVTSMGLSQAFGSLTGMIANNNTLFANATYYNLAELNTSYPADFLIDPVAQVKKAYVMAPLGTGGITHGSSSGAAATTWYERGALLNANGRSLSTNASNLSNWTIDWERVTLRGLAANATFFRGNVSLVDCAIFHENSLTIANGAASLTGIVRRCFFSHSAHASTITLGSATFPLAEVSDLDIESETTSSADICSGIFATIARGIGVRGTGTFRSFFGANTANAFDLEEVEFSGTPTTAHFRWGGSSANGWKVRGATWVEGVDKVVIVSSGFPTLANALLDGHKFNFRFVSKATGAALSGKRVKLTDELGNLVVDDTSDSDGWVRFGTGKDVQNVWLADWYAVGTVETLRTRYKSMKVEINPAGDPSYDASLESITHEEWEWPTTAPYTLSTGSFLPVTWVQPLGPAPDPEPPGPPGPYVRQNLPNTAFNPSNVPGTPFVAADVDGTEFERTIPPDSLFSPCDAPEEVVTITEEHVIMGGVVIPVEVETVTMEGGTDVEYTKRLAAATGFTHRAKPNTGFTPRE